MKNSNFILTILFITMLTSAGLAQSTVPFDAYPVYSGNDLGVTYSPSKTDFKVWAPKASQVTLRLYEAGDGGQATGAVSMEKGTNGLWTTSINRDLKNKYYTFQVMQDGVWLSECPDIYAKAVGVNGKRGMVADMPSTNPENWESDEKPQLKSFNDIIIYELH